jgi:hypothetical protein
MWRTIVDLSETRNSGVTEIVPIPTQVARGWVMKAFEDQLDAEVCV